MDVSQFVWTKRSNPVVVRLKIVFSLGKVPRFRASPEMLKLLENIPNIGRFAVMSALIPLKRAYHRVERPLLLPMETSRQ